MSLRIKLSEFKNRVKLILFPYIPQLIRYKQGGKKNIILFSSRRGGSTIFAQLLSSEPKTRYIDQPFDLTPDSIYKDELENHLPSTTLLSQFISVEDEQNKKTINNYLNRILSGGIPKLWKTHNWPNNRTLLKVCNAISLANWICENYDIIPIAVLRHPIPQALAVIKNNWINTCKAYLENEAYCNNYLNNDNIDLGRKIITNGSLLEKYVLNWILENLPVINNKLITKIYYEDLVLEPLTTIHTIVNIAKIEGKPEELLKIIQKPSFSKSFSDERTNQAIENGNKEYLINKWQEKITPAEKSTINHLLKSFGVNIYNSNSPLPQYKL